jgi:hypothetical protein
MTRMTLLFGVITTLGVAFAYFGWKLTARGAYESAEYTVLESEGAFETREYPTLEVAATRMRFEDQGGDGSFMRLFRYIGGKNADEQKIAMTTPVLMEKEDDDSIGKMRFVLPKKTIENGVPRPSDEGVEILKRMGGRFATIRFKGRTSSETFSDAEQRLRDWMTDQGLVGDGDAEFASYDPPWTPGPLRRNEVLIRIELASIGS